MRSLKALTENNSVVWFFCRNECLAKRFLEQCETEGFLALNGQKPTELVHQKFYGIFDDMTMGYLSSMIWSLTFRANPDDRLRVDYEKYCSGKEDFICHRTRTKGSDYSHWNQIAYSNALKPRVFAELCNRFIEGQSFEEYNAYVFRYLIESDWHYIPEQAVQRMMWEDYLITECYEEKTPVADCAVEVGYGCG